MGDWRPSFGAVRDGAHWHFRVAAAGATSVQLRHYRDGALVQAAALRAVEGGYFDGRLAGVRPGDRYDYLVDGGGPFPDPASRFQPAGVHGPSEIIDPSAFEWSDAAWGGCRPEALVIYELHVGTFTPEGTFAAAAARLPYLADLGITVVELMPVADFPGARNWGYDGASLFAPARSYGRPDDLRQFVDRAHALGLAVHLDVVYNHVGPDGAYLAAFEPALFSTRHRNPWGAGINLDGPGSERVRAFLIENALHWVHEYHLDGLRLDATHALEDDSPRHFLAELTARIRETSGARRVQVVAEDHRNLAVMIRPPEDGGWGLDGVWADDFHHQMRRLVAGDTEGYYRDFSGTVQDLAATIRQGWFFCGQYSDHLQEPRGTNPAGIPPHKFVVCIQNHDQIGNRAFGDRLHHAIELHVYRAASAILLMAPETPLLFMGQEWAAGTPFLYFTDHHAELGELVRQGRREEFRHFQLFSNPASRARIPDPQAGSTFEASRLQWDERAREPHAATERLYRRLLEVRRELTGAGADGATVEAIGSDALLLIRRAPGFSVAAVARFRGSGAVRLATERGDLEPSASSAAGPHDRWELLLDTEAPEFGGEAPVQVDVSEGRPTVVFHRPGAVLFRIRHATE